MSAAKYHVGPMQSYMIKQIHGFIIEPTKIDLMKYKTHSWNRGFLFFIKENWVSVLISSIYPFACFRPFSNSSDKIEWYVIDTLFQEGNILRQYLIPASGAQS